MERLVGNAHLRRRNAAYGPVPQRRVLRQCMEGLKRPRTFHFHLSGICSADTGEIPAQGCGVGPEESRTSRQTLGDARRNWVGGFGNGSVPPLPLRSNAPVTVRLERWSPSTYHCGTWQTELGVWRSEHYVGLRAYLVCAATGSWHGPMGNTSTNVLPLPSALWKYK
jgi:hypothetical protein